MQFFALGLSIFFTALGMVMMVRMDLVQNPPDGFVKLAAEIFKKEFGSVKVLYDVVCVIFTLSIGMVCLKQPYGMGIATIASALLVGRTVSLINKIVPQKQ